MMYSMYIIILYSHIYATYLVSPGFMLTFDFCTYESSKESKVFINVDLPTLDRPITAIYVYKYGDMSRVSNDKYE